MEKSIKQLAKSVNPSVFRIALVGPESSGKSTLASQLSEYFKTVWTPEFAREYLQNKLVENQELCTIDDLLTIALGQIQNENEQFLKATSFLFCDTCTLQTKIYSKINYATCNEKIDLAVQKHNYDLYLLTDIDVPFSPDGLRSTPKDRNGDFEVFKQELISLNKPFIVLSGNQEVRLNNAIQILKDLKKALNFGFSSFDFLQIFNHGIPVDNILDQLRIFNSGISKSILIRPATLFDGIIKLQEKEILHYSDFFVIEKKNYNLIKFVPASGAASRMFKFLNEFLNEFDIEKETINGYINRKNDKELSIFILGMNKFPFFEEIYLSLKKEFHNFDSLDRDYKNYYFIKTMISSSNFDFANKPKGVIPFHRYRTHIATAIEEHLLECESYASSNNQINLHFTVSENHKFLFENIIRKILENVTEIKKSQIKISFSFQKKRTDTIAVDSKNKPFRDAEGKLFFRPGGHGALIENLNNLESDIVFIKNIDNVTQNNSEKNALYKKALAGILIEKQKQIFNYLNELEKESDENIDDICEFISNNLKIEIHESFSKFTTQNKIAYLKSMLNRPIRVCGMVRNEGEPGGGPFWVMNSRGNFSLQIVESSQVDLSSSNQVKILKSATHFNPVDLVCGIKNFKGEKFDLKQFIDHESGFIVDKTLNAKPIRSYELPGLWNGAMSNWITIFVEVPLFTFNPVKTVNDLLKASHQPQ